MDKYEQEAVIGEGSYGVVLRCKHKESGQTVAIKKFLETEEDVTVRKMALREIRMLKRLRHENLVPMIEVFRHKKRFYLVFEYLAQTVLGELEAAGGGLPEAACRERIFQVVRAVRFCHANNVVHRDIKPENVLVSTLGVVKLCDFGFARLVSAAGEACTEYVATRWYRAPELLVGEAAYGAAVDVWAVGCLFAEMMTGEPLFAGDSDIDQLYLIVRALGRPCARHQQLMAKSSQLRGIIRSAVPEPTLGQRFPQWSTHAADFLAGCVRMDPAARFSSDELLRAPLFVHDGFPQRFLPALRDKIATEFGANPLLRRFKSETLLAADREDAPRPPRPPEPTRWRIHVDGSDRRAADADRRLISLGRTSRRLSVLALRANDVCAEGGEPGPARAPQPTVSGIALTSRNAAVPPRPLQSIGNLAQGGRGGPLKRPVQVDSLVDVGGAPSTWLSSVNLQRKRDAPKERRGDDFSLPTLPGAVPSPNRSHKKCIALEPSPRIQSTTSQNSSPS